MSPFKVLAIVQARVGSSRLPGKALMTLGGRPMLAHILERAKLIPQVDEVLLATSASERDQALAGIAWPMSVRCWFGSEWDVLRRTTEAVRWADGQVIMRLTADCPFLDPAVAGHVLDRFFATPDVDYMSNDTTVTGYPDGTDVEVFTRAALEAADFEASDRGDREHVTPWIRRHKRCATVFCAAGDFSRIKLSVDTPADYEVARAVAARLPPGAFDLAATIAAYEHIRIPKLV